jgi:hypothetical protein
MSMISKNSMWSNKVVLCFLVAIVGISAEPTSTVVETRRERTLGRPVHSPGHIRCATCNYRRPCHDQGDQRRPPGWRHGGRR